MPRRLWQGGWGKQPSAVPGRLQQAAEQLTGRCAAPLVDTRAEPRHPTLHPPSCRLTVKGQRLKLLWGKPQAARPAPGGPPGAGAPPGGPDAFPSYMPAGPGGGGYASMDPSAMGSRAAQQQQQGGPMRPPMPRQPPVGQ